MKNGDDGCYGGPMSTVGDDDDDDDDDNGDDDDDDDDGGGGGGGGSGGGGDDDNDGNGCCSDDVRDGEKTTIIIITLANPCRGEQRRISVSRRAQPLAIIKPLPADCSVSRQYNEQP